jgi:hypothetical protein
MSKKIEVYQENARPRILLLGAVAGAVVGLIAAGMIISRAERKDADPQVTAVEGVKLGLLVFGLLREIAQLGDGK